MESTTHFTIGGVMSKFNSNKYFAIEIESDMSFEPLKQALHESNITFNIIKNASPMLNGETFSISGTDLTQFLELLQSAHLLWKKYKVYLVK